MDIRKKLMLFITAILVVSVCVGSIYVLTTDSSSPIVNKATLENVRDYAVGTDDINYAVDGDQLFRGNLQGWTMVETPADMMVSTVAVDTNSANGDILYIGAANEMALYRSTDAGANWTRFELSADALGMVTEIAVDSIQNLVYVGTDTAGIFRLRDVGSGMTLSGQLLLDERVQEIVVDEIGVGMAFARTDSNLYRAENFGLKWTTVNNLRSLPTALAIAGTEPLIYVGTVDRGLLKSQDGGLSWALVNEGLNAVPGSRLQISALTVDPEQPQVLYVASNYLYGSTTAHSTPSVVALSLNDARTWNILDESTVLEGTVAKLLPVANTTGAVYALTTASRAPQALGAAPVMVAAADATEIVEAASIGGMLSLLNTTLLSWLIAGIAALALLFAIGSDLYRKESDPEAVPVHVSNT